MRGRAIFGAVALLFLAGCTRAPQPSGPRVIAVEGFLADISQQVAGDRITVQALLPPGVDPHSYEPTPRDIVAVEKTSLLIINGAGLEAFLEKIIGSTDSSGRAILEASRGLASRRAHDGGETDPHFWLDPVMVITYVENIRAGLATLDPAGAATYARNAQLYTAKLRELDAWIASEVALIPEAERVLVTNHESFGYFADRYGFRIIGTVIPSVTTGSEPTAQELARLVDAMKSLGARAIFLETGANSKLARQAAQEAGVRTVTELYTHSLTDAKGPAPTYVDMMRTNTRIIVEALTGKSADAGSSVGAGGGAAAGGGAP